MCNVISLGTNSCLFSYASSLVSGIVPRGQGAGDGEGLSVLHPQDSMRVPHGRCKKAVFQGHSE